MVHTGGDTAPGQRRLLHLSNEMQPCDCELERQTAPTWLCAGAAAPVAPVRRRFGAGSSLPGIRSEVSSTQVADSNDRPMVLPARIAGVRRNSTSGARSRSTAELFGVLCWCQAKIRGDFDMLPPAGGDARVEESEITHCLCAEKADACGSERQARNCLPYVCPLSHAGEHVTIASIAFYSTQCCVCTALSVEECVVDTT